MQVEDYRISKLRNYLFNVINTLTENRSYQINANMLSNRVDDYSLDKIPTDTQVEAWIIGVTKKREVCKANFSFFYIFTISSVPSNSGKSDCPNVILGLLISVCSSGLPVRSR